MWQEVVRKIRESVKEGRELRYEEGAVGITALLSCPIKWELSQRYDLEPSAVEVDDGFLWERQVKDAVKSLYGDGVCEEKDLIYEVGDFRLHGHLDILIQGEEVIGIELKSPKVLLFREIPKSAGDLYEDKGIVLHNPLYLKQVRLQRLLLEKLYPDRKVKTYLFYKALCRHGNWSKKLYVVSEIKESMTEDELRELIRSFKEDRSPRYAGECENYCVFYREGLCEGKPYEPKAQTLTPEIQVLLSAYRELNDELRALESQLKKNLTGFVKVNGKEIGWVKRKSVELDVERLAEVLPRERYPEVFQVKWNKKWELIKNYGSEIVKSEREVLEWRI